MQALFFPVGLVVSKIYNKKLGFRTFFNSFMSTGNSVTGVDMNVQTFD